MLCIGLDYRDDKETQNFDSLTDRVKKLEKEFTNEKNHDI